MSSIESQHISAHSAYMSSYSPFPDIIFILHAVIVRGYSYLILYMFNITGTLYISHIYSLALCVNINL